MSSTESLAASPLNERTFLERRLLLALATPIVALLVLGTFLGFQLLRMAEDTEWVEHTDQVISAAQQTKLAIIDQETSVRGYIVNGDRAFLEPYDRANPLENFAVLDKLVADNPSQRARFAEAKRRYEQWIALVKTSIEDQSLALARSPANMNSRKAIMDGVRETLRVAIETEETLRAQRYATSQASTTRTKWIFVSLLSLVAIMLAFLSRAQLGSIASTFGAALDSQKAANAAMAKEAWIREGQARISAALLGEKNLQQLGVDCLAAIAEYTRADIGALFIRDSGAWHRRAGIALDSRVGGADVFAEGEGLVGRAADTRKLLVVSDAPKDYLKIRSGTGEAVPPQLAFVPAGVEGRVNAVIELGFVRAVDDAAIELLNRIGENVALAVRSAEYKQRLRDLLEETQRQSEELQSQQEELKVQNEELEQQTRALQDAHTRMQGQQAELEQINSQLEEQTQTLERQRDDLSQSQGDLQRVSAYKSEFLANMSHELRTPLNSSLILAKLLTTNRKGHLDAEEVQYAQTIYTAGNDLLTLINDILDLSKIEAGKLDVRPESIRVARMVSELNNIFAPIAKDKGLQLTLAVDEQVPELISSDATRLQQILRNLLSNALKFTEMGSVEFNVGMQAGKLAFRVKDTGIGIPAEQQGVIFEAFRQADGTTNRKFGGTGLGLSISRELSRLLGGELTVQSEAGRGSTFTLLLPREFAAGERAFEPQPSTPARSHAAPAPRPAPAPSAPRNAIADDREQLSPGVRTILIVEDDVPFAAVLRDLAHELHFQAVIAQTAGEGLALAASIKPSAVILDVRLPDRSGLSVLDALKHNPATRHIPVHMMSATDHAQAALQMGAAGYAIKPVTREQLVAALKRLENKFTQSVRRILVVEDDAIHRQSTCQLLAGPGVQVEAVGTAAEALEKLGATTFDCLILDLSLPDRSGFELLDEIANREQYGFPPVIVYTGRSLSREEEQQLRQYSQSIIIKGARSPERLLDEVTLFLHQVEDELPPERQRMLQEARHREAVFEGRRVLVVEDDIRNIFALKAVLEPKGAVIEIARNGREALDHLKNKPGVDLVLMDIMMPEMDGLEATREIRKQPQHAKLPIIALTAKAMSDDRENCLAAGASDYIAKPLDVDKLLSLARVWLPK